MESENPQQTKPTEWTKLYNLRLGRLALGISFGISLNWALWYDRPIKTEGEKAHHVFSIQIRERTFEDGMKLKALSFFFWIFAIQVCPVLL